MATANQGEGFLTVLRKRNFLYLWLAQLISMTALYASNYALLVLIEDVTGSTTLVGLAIIAFSLPALLFGAPAGVFVDHMNKRWVLWVSNCLRAVCTFVFVITLLVDRHQLVAIYLLTFLISTIGQFFTPAEGSSISLLVSENELVPALSLFNITMMLSQALGYILLAPIALSLLPTFKLAHIPILPVEELYALISVFYVICALLIWLIPQASFTQKTRAKTSDLMLVAPRASALSVMRNVWQEMTQGWSFVRSRKPLFLAVIQLSFAGVLLLVLGELATPIVTKLLELPAKAMAFVFAPAGIGLVAGSVIMPRVTQQLGKSRTIFIGTALLTVVTILLPLTTLLARTVQPQSWNANPLLLFTIALWMFLAGGALACINIPAQTTIQEQTPNWIKGRVLALQLVLYNACAIPVILFVGAFADLFGVDRVLYLMSVCELAFGIWGVYYGRRHGLSAVTGESEDRGNTSDQLERDRILP